MNITIYMSEELSEILEKATIVKSDKVPNHNLILVDADSTVDAVLGGKQQIASEKASVKFVCDETNYELFMKNKHRKKEVKDDNTDKDDI